MLPKGYNLAGLQWKRLKCRSWGGHQTGSLASPCAWGFHRVNGLVGLSRQPVRSWAWCSWTQVSQASVATMLDARGDRAGRGPKCFRWALSGAAPFFAMILDCANQDRTMGWRLPRWVVQPRTGYLSPAAATARSAH